MNFEVYCDECYPDVFSSGSPPVQYMAIGSLWLPSEIREQCKSALHELRNKHKVGGEFKWQKVSPSRENFYLDLIRWFISMDDQIRFRCILVDHSQVELDTYHGGNQELGFYKFYYQLLHHWIVECNEYRIFCDFKSNRRRNRLHVLQGCLQNSNLFASVPIVQAIKSDESVLIQLVDVLAGAVAAKMNKKLKQGSAKERVVGELENKLNKQIAPTARSTQKFNVFKINLRGGWQL